MNVSKIANELMRVADELVEGDETEWGFDTSDFGSSVRFIRVLSAVGINPRREPGRGHIGEFIWTGSGIMIATCNNPITGEFQQANQRRSQPGYASYIGIKGNPHLVARAVAAIKRNATSLGEESIGKRDYI